MASQWWSDDEQLLASLTAALRAGSEVPREFVETGKAAYAWHNIDAELAALTYDSDLDELALAAVTRAQPAPLRALTFASAELTIELEVTPDALLGQIVPAQAGRVTAHLQSGQLRSEAVDEMGAFVFRPMPAGPFRLRYRAGSGADIVTGWITP
ncbi:MAG TPA: hypothetical protein VFR67_20680 [Pilimelia sp.]|nr:hypothetical protein [Pilimelia sp.]